MKLLELLPSMKDYQRIYRPDMGFVIIRSLFENNHLVELDYCSLQLRVYTPTYEDLIADDWEIYPSLEINNGMD